MVIYWFFIVLHKGTKWIKKIVTTEETFALAVQNQQKNNLQIAEKLYKETLKTNPNHVDAYNNLGVILLRSGKPRKAKSCYMKRQSKSILIMQEAHNNLGNALNLLGEYQKAKSCYEKAIEINPNYASAHNNLGNLLNVLEEYQKAKSCYEKAIEINPNHVDSHNNFGTVLQKLGEYQKAKSCYKKAF